MRTSRMRSRVRSGPGTLLNTVAAAIAIVGALGGVARSEYVEFIDPPRPSHDQLLGFRIGGGMLQADHTKLDFAGLAVAIEHRLYGAWRLSAEYDYTFLSRVSRRDAEMDRKNTGNGHDLVLALRHRAFQSKWLADDRVQFYVDAELGGGVLLGHETSVGTVVVPHALVGLRAGYRVRLLRDSRSSAVWEPEFLLRGIVTRSDEPIGWMVGIGAHWGD